MRKLADMRAALALMQWDQETYLPVKGTGFRAQQVATLSEMAHEMATSKKLGSLLEKLDNAPGLNETEKKNIADIIIAKHRNGPVGEISLYFQASNTRFRDLELNPSAE